MMFASIMAAQRRRWGATAAGAEAAVQSQSLPPAWSGYGEDGWMHAYIGPYNEATL